MLPKFSYITTDQELEIACKHLETCDTLGIDIECENNLHHYGTYISLIQISSRTQNFIVDIMQFKTIDPLKKILENPSIVKIFHNIDFDLRVLNFQFACKPKNLFDTQLAATFLNFEQVGLGALQKMFFNIEKQKKFQKADWTLRPLTHDMLAYAMQDTTHLIRLKSKLEDLLKEKNILSFMKAEIAYQETRNFMYKEPSYIDFKGVKTLTPQQRAIFKHLHEARTELAQSSNRPIHFIINNRMLLELAIKPITDINVWKRMRGIHPIVRKKSSVFLNATLKGMKEEDFIEKTDKKRLNPEQRDRIQKINEARDKVADKMHIPRHLILSKDEIKSIVVNNNTNYVRDWQKQIFKQNGINLNNI